MEIKICTKCNLKLDANLHNFNAQKTGKYGLRSKCKKCFTEYSKEYIERPEAKEANRIRQQKWISKNPEKAKKNKKKYRENNSEKLKELKKKWQEANPEIVKAYNDLWVKELKDGYLKYILTKKGFKKEEVTPELIEVQKIIIKTKRLCKTSQI
jgi:predicted phage tail protein